MNPFWKQLFIILAEVIIVSLVLYEIIHKTTDPEDRLSLFLMSILLIIIFIHLIINSKRMLYNFGYWFSCRY